MTFSSPSDRSGSATGSLKKKAALITIAGATAILAGCSLFDSEPVVETAAVEQKEEFACYREARYLKLAPETCEEVGGVVVAGGIPDMTVKKPEASPSTAVVRVTLPIRNITADLSEDKSEDQDSEKVSSVILPLDRKKSSIE